MIRSATLADLPELVRIENLSFVTDRFSRRSFRYLLTKANAKTLVEEQAGQIRGYVMLLFNVGTSLARLYSYAVDPNARRQGIGKALVEQAEMEAIEHDCIAMRLEIRQDNEASINLFKQHGYRQIGMVPDYYEDGMTALRFEKSLASHLQPELVRVPFYEQTLDFTCGPSALLMAMNTIDPEIKLDRTQELRLWRESTTIFMTSGHGGCGPYGLALAAYHRGFDVELFIKEKGTMFLDSVRNEEKKEVMRLVQEDFINELKSSSVKIHYRKITVDELQGKFEAGGIPIVLISSYRIYHEKFPHWVVVTGFDEKYIYVHDPFVDYDAQKSPTDCINMPILKKDFEHMAKYGKAGQKAVLIIKKRGKQT
jgi:ribosomal protein S18 acetylase RimI-like enzyme/predicted peroxiredoxin